jgi:hypothetical protein
MSAAIPRSAARFYVSDTYETRLALRDVSGGGKARKYGGRKGVIDALGRCPKPCTAVGSHWGKSIPSGPVSGDAQILKESTSCRHIYAVSDRHPHGITNET